MPGALTPSPGPGDNLGLKSQSTGADGCSHIVYPPEHNVRTTYLSLGPAAHLHDESADVHIADGRGSPKF